MPIFSNTYSKEKSLQGLIENLMLSPVSGLVPARARALVLVLVLSLAALAPCHARDPARARCLLHAHLFSPRLGGECYMYQVWPVSAHPEHRPGHPGCVRSG